MMESPLYVLKDTEKDEIVAITEDYDTATRYAYFRTHKFCDIHRIDDVFYKNKFLTDLDDLYLVYIDNIDKFVTEKDYRMYFQDTLIHSADLVISRGRIEDIILSSEQGDYSKEDIRSLFRTIQIINEHIEDNEKHMIDIERRL